MFTLFRVLLVLVAVLSLVSAYGCGKSEGPSADKQAQPERKPEEAHETTPPDSSLVHLPADRVKAFGISLQPAEMGALPETITATAVIEPNADRIAHVTSRIPARVVQVFGQLGDEVRKGETLALLDSPAHTRAEAEYLKASASLKVALAAFERHKLLYEKGIGALKNFQAAEADYLRAKADLEASEQELRLLGFGQEEIDRLKRGGKSFHDTFPLLSPFAGRIVEKHVAAGEVVDPSTKLFTLADLSTVWIILDVYEKDLADVEIGKDVSISVFAYPDLRLTGKITYVSDLVDEKTRTAKIRVEVENSDTKLKPGMFAEAKITTHGTKTTLLIPKSAVVHIDARPVVFVKISDTEFLKREVQLGAESDNWVNVTNGLKEGEVIVTEGSFYLKSTLLREQIGGEE